MVKAAGVRCESGFVGRTFMSMRQNTRYSCSRTDSFKKWSCVRTATRAFVRERETEKTRVRPSGDVTRCRAKGY